MIDDGTERRQTMKKLNITKEAFEKSNYFKNKYGKLEYVSESGKLFKTNKGKILKFKESTKKFGKKFTKEDRKTSFSGDWSGLKDRKVGDIDKDPAYQCPYCGSHDCEFDDAEDLGSGLQEGYFDGATFNAQFWCNECNKPYNVQFELKVKDVYPNEDLENLEDEDI